MFEKYMICENGFHNVSEHGQLTGFQIRVRIGYYRGMPLSVLEDYAVTVDGQKIPPEDIRFSVGGRTFTLQELETTTDFRWQFDEIATVTVKKAGELTPGMHDLKVSQQLRIPYTETRDVSTAGKKMTLVS